MESRMRGNSHVRFGAGENRKSFIGWMLPIAINAYTNSIKSLQLLIRYSRDS